MDAAFEEVLSLGQTSDVQMAALNNSRPGHRDVGKAAGALRNGWLAIVEPRYESPTELRHLRKGVGSPPWSTTERMVPFLITNLSGSKSQPGSGFPAAALVNRSVSVVA